jgi:hypothetical protein
MKVSIAILVCCYCFVVGKAQSTDTIGKVEAGDTIRQYKTEGEQEDGWAKTFFVPAAPRQAHERYKGKIESINDHTFRYGTRILRVEPDTTGLLAIFGTGILYPGMFRRGDIQVIAGVKEMEFLRTPTARRFRMQVRFMGMANPVLYFFELTNDKATVDTPTVAFIQGAVLTFFKEYSVLL